MRVLVLGGGGREHALVFKLRQSQRVERVFSLPGSDALSGLSTCLGGDASDAATVLAAVEAQRVDLTVIGPEAPLAAGVADALRAAGRLVFGPSRAAAQLEASKSFAKRFMQQHRIPTARFAEADDAAGARRALASLGYPVVIKADGLAAGKGVVIAADATEAEVTVEAMLAGELVGVAGRHLVIEECLRGPELSLLAVCDGERWRLLPPAQDHKRLLEQDRGPNTGGMGAFSVDALLDRSLRQQVEQQVIAPTLAGMAAAGTPFQGVLYCGLMLTGDGPRVLEFNARFGDPETQPVLLRWGGDLAQLLLGAARGRLPDLVAEEARAAAAACVIAAAEGYPASPRRGDEIIGLNHSGQLANDPDVVIFHAGTRRREGHWETAGGRVLGATAAGACLEQARAACERALAQIQFRGMQFRRDIGAAWLEQRAASIRR